MRAHVHGAVHERLLDGIAGARIDVVHREAGLDRGNAPHVIGAAVRRRRAAVENARFVEVDMRLDQPRRPV